MVALSATPPTPAISRNGLRRKAWNGNWSKSAPQIWCWATQGQSPEVQILLPQEERGAVWRACRALGRAATL